MYIDSIGYFAGVCMAISFIPQAFKTFQTKNVSGLSAFTYGIYNLGVLAWVFYGYLINSKPMFFFNIICLCFSLPILVMIIKYKKKGLPISNQKSKI